jgi:hypothetical protein
VAGWAGSSRWISDCNLAKKRSTRVVSGRICVAHGSIALLCTGRISMVPPLAAALPAVGLNDAPHHLDSEHHSHICPMALARTWASVGIASWLGDAAGIRMRGSGQCNFRVSTLRRSEVRGINRKSLKHNSLHLHSNLARRTLRARALSNSCDGPGFSCSASH